MSVLQVQILSDLHLEAPSAYDNYEIPPKAPILALLGDIGQACDPGWIEFLERQLSIFHTVLLVLGNHEPYHSDWNRAREVVRTFNESYEQRRSASQGTLILLDKTRVDVSDTFTILGCTLHSKVDAKYEEQISFGVNDFYYIEGGWDVSRHCQAHQEELAWLNGQVTSIARESPHRRIAILTHHSPCMTADSVDPKHASSPISSAFSTDLSDQSCWTSQNVKLWAWPHALELRLYRSCDRQACCREPTRILFRSSRWVRSDQGGHDVKTSKKCYGCFLRHFRQIKSFSISYRMKVLSYLLF